MVIASTILLELFKLFCGMDDHDFRDCYRSSIIITFSKTEYVSFAIITTILLYTYYMYSSLYLSLIIIL